MLFLANSSSIIIMCRLRVDNVDSGTMSLPVAI